MICLNCGVEFLVKLSHYGVDGTAVRTALEKYVYESRTRNSEDDDMVTLFGFFVG